MSDERPVVRGTDFTGYRIGGAIAAVLLLIAFSWQVFELFDGDSMTVPERSWSTVTYRGEEVGEVPAAAGSGTLTQEILRERTRLQDERWRTGPAPEAEVPSYAIGQGEFIASGPMVAEGRQLTESWRRLDGDTGAMLRASERVEGISSLPYPNADLFERPEARDWRLGIADFITHLGALAILGFSLLLALILAIRGRVPIAKGRSPRSIKRFSLLERATHWMTATSFLGLAITGIVIAYGETLIQPFGDYALGTLGWWSTWGHAMFFPPFALGIVVMAIMWTLRNLPSRLDIEWLRRGGGFFSDSPDNPPARKFNAGQKLIFWSAILGGLVMVGTGVTLMFPFLWLELDAMGWVMLVHATVGVLLIAIFIGHIYIGTVGMQGAIDAMWGGRVDYNWAEEHHELWVKELEAKGKLR